MVLWQYPSKDTRSLPRQHLEHADLHKEIIIIMYVQIHNIGR